MSEQNKMNAFMRFKVFELLFFCVCLGWMNLKLLYHHHPVGCIYILGLLFIYRETVGQQVYVFSKCTWKSR